MRSLFTAFILLSGLAHAGEPLNRREWMLEGAFIAAALIDYRQTRDIKNHCESRVDVAPNVVPVGDGSEFRQRCEPVAWEQNRLLGRHPSDSRIRNYFLGVAIGHVAVTHLLPRKYRPYWQWGSLAIEIAVIHNNYQAGLRMNF